MSTAVHIAPYAPHSAPAIDGIMIARLSDALAPVGLEPKSHQRLTAAPGSRESLEFTSGTAIPTPADGPSKFTVTVVADTRPHRWTYEVRTFNSGESQAEVRPRQIQDWEGVIAFGKSLAKSDAIRHPFDVVSGAAALEHHLFPATDGHPLLLPFEQIRNYAAEFVAQKLHQSGVPCFAVHHPRETRSCEEKRALLEEHPALYQYFGTVRVAQGAVLSFKDAGGTPRFILHIQDAFDGAERRRVDTKALKAVYGIPKKTDLRFASEDLTQVIGVAPGAVSPLVANNHELWAIHFDPTLFAAERANPFVLFDFAIECDRSLLVSPSHLACTLAEHSSIGKVIRPSFFTQYSRLAKE